MARGGRGQPVSIVIKRLAFVEGAAVADAEAAWAQGAEAPEAVRPARLAWCTVLPELNPDARHDAVGLAWFEDEAHLARFDWWAAVGSEEPGTAHRTHPHPQILGGGVVLDVDEVVLRGEAWLAERWARGGEVLKQMSLALRAEGLSAGTFSQRWRAHAGTAGGAPVPDDALGCAYVQDHPLSLLDEQRPYDAVNEVWFEDEDGLRRRLDWYAEQQVGAPDDLFGASWSLVVRERVLGGLAGM